MEAMKQESEGSGEQFGKFPFLQLRLGLDFPQIYYSVWENIK